MSVWPGSGFIPIILYGVGTSVSDDSLAILTEASLNLLTENGLNIDIEN